MTDGPDFRRPPCTSPDGPDRPSHDSRSPSSPSPGSTPSGRCRRSCAPGSRRRCWPPWPTACPSRPTPNPSTPPAPSPKPSGPGWNPPSWPKPPPHPRAAGGVPQRDPAWRPGPSLGPLRRDRSRSARPATSSRWTAGGGGRSWRRGRRWRPSSSFVLGWRGWPAGVATPGRATSRWPARRPPRRRRRRLSPRTPASPPMRPRPRPRGRTGHGHHPGRSPQAVADHHRPGGARCRSAAATPAPRPPASSQPDGGSTQPAPTESSRGPAPPFYDSTAPTATPPGPRP